jgi:hypothetical protein
MRAALAIFFSSYYNIGRDVARWHSLFYLANLANLLI